MSRLRIFSEADPQVPLYASHEHAAIAAQLGAAGVRFEQWQPAEALAPGTPPEQVIGAFQRDIDRLKAEGGYQAVDVISLAPDHPERETLRKKFLDEHTHAEDEVRFFVAGSGLFSLHIGDKVFEVLCEAGDLIGVPHGTRHWFDMGPQPSFIAIRMFTNPAGWVAEFTGDSIAAGFPRYETDEAA